MLLKKSGRRGPYLLKIDTPLTVSNGDNPRARVRIPEGIRTGVALSLTFPLTGFAALA
jgi:hypothetical protein